MSIDEIKNNGLLELYVLDQLSSAEKSAVESALNSSADLRNELQEIENAFEAFAQSGGVKPSEGFKDQLMKQVSERSSTNTSEVVQVPPNKGFAATSLFLLALLGATLTYVWYQHSNNQDTIAQYQKEIAVCDSTVNAQVLELELLENIKNPNNSIYAFEATEKFQEVDLILFNNTKENKNYLKVNALPTISNDYAFQLWSLKEGQDPIPLSIFRANNGNIIPVDFEKGSANYAITIEKKEGATAPNMDQLIAIVTV